MADQKTTGDLRKAAEIADDEINAAVDALLAKPKTGSYPIGGGYLLDLGVAEEAYLFSRGAPHAGSRAPAKAAHTEHGMASR